MLIRISLIVAILAGLAVGSLNYFKIKDKITKLQSELKTETEAHQKFEGDYRRTKNDLDKTNAVLKTTQETLKATEDEKNKAVAEAAAQIKRAEKLTEDLNKTRQERDGAQSELAAYKATGLTPQQIALFNKQYKTLQNNLAATAGENKVLLKKIDKLQTELAGYRDPNTPVPLPAGLRGKVLISDPKWQFVVVNIGEDQGVKERGELLINRNGKLVAKVKVTSVQKDRSIANVMPGWQLGDIIEGDQVIPAHPAS